ncbi:Protein HIR2, partial [Dissostichus eleginoides]
TDCVSGMCECAGHLQFYTMLSDQSGGWCWRVTGRVLRAAGLSGQAFFEPVFETLAK